MELNDAAKAEIADAVRILREDGVHIHKTYKQFMASLETEEPPEPKEGDPPPPKEDPVEEKPKKKKGIGLWGAEE